jgi:hypothetical protein
MQEEFQGNPLLQKYEAAIFFDSAAQNERECVHSGVNSSKGNPIYMPVLTSVLCVLGYSPLLT